MTLQPGERLGPYEIAGLLGAGGMGEVYRANDPRLRRVVALKVLRSEAGTAAHARLLREARAAASLQHPRICVVHDIWEHGSLSYLVMECLEGETLAARLARGPMSVGEILTIAIEIVEALSAAHQRGMVHRDLKPGNVMLAPTGVKLLDFGLARELPIAACGGGETAPSVATMSLDGSIVGTVSYMSPEQARGLPAVIASDLFSLGTMLYEMLTGHRPFDRSSVVETLAAIIREEPAPLGELEMSVPPPLAWIVERCLAKAPSARYGHTRDLLRDLTALRTYLDRGPAPSELRLPRLPDPPTPLVGRRDEVDAVASLLAKDEVRLVTLTGPAGTGKTRVAIQAATDLVGRFKGGVAFVTLGGVTEPASLLPAIAQTLGVRPSAGRPLAETIQESLGRTGSEAALLVLDNFEQLLPAAMQVSDLLASCPMVKVLVTSRAPLRLYGEQEYPISPLAVPGPSQCDSKEALSVWPAVALFVQRAAAARPGFALTDENAGDIAQICAGLDGLPLAIELAAARLKLLSPSAIRGRLQGRLQLLTGGARDLPVRQQTLRAALDWSHDLLDPFEQTLFRRLSVFAGGATLEAVEAVCGGEGGITVDILDGLASLVDKSLVARSEAGGEEPRFRMLEVIREYGLERLRSSGECEVVQQAHAQYYLGWVETMREARDSSEGVCLDLLELERANCRAACDWFLAASSREPALRMCVALWPFWETRGYWTEGREQLARALAEGVEAISAQLLAKALYAAGVLADAQQDYETARLLFERHLAVQRTVGDPRAVAAATNNLGVMALRQADYETAMALYLETLETLRGVASQAAVAGCLNNLGHVALCRREFRQARTWYEESLEISRTSGHARGVAWTLSNLGDVSLEEGNLPDAESRYSESLSIFRALNDKAGTASCLADLAWVSFLQGKDRLAGSLYQEGLVLFGLLGDRRGVCRILEGFALMASSRDQWPALLRLAGAAWNIRRMLGVRTAHTRKTELETCLRRARESIGAEADALWADGSRMSIEAAMQYALDSAST
jgi:predicted ATPase